MHKDKLMFEVDMAFSAGYVLYHWPRVNRAMSYQKTCETQKILRLKCLSSKSKQLSSVIPLECV